MKQTEGYNDGSNHICKLMKSLYGSKQTARCCYKHFSHFLKKLGLMTNQADPCLSVKGKDESTFFYCTLHGQWFSCIN